MVKLMKLASALAAFFLADAAEPLAKKPRVDETRSGSSEETASEHGEPNQDAEESTDSSSEEPTEPARKKEVKLKSGDPKFPDVDLIEFPGRGFVIRFDGMELELLYMENKIHRVLVTSPRELTTYFSGFREDPVRLKGPEMENQEGYGSLTHDEDHYAVLFGNVVATQKDLPGLNQKNWRLVFFAGERDEFIVWVGKSRDSESSISINIMKFLATRGAKWEKSDRAFNTAPSAAGSSQRLYHQYVFDRQN